jgi:hypothetical protein
MAPPLSINIIYNKSCTTGLHDDVIIIERILKKLQDAIGQPISKARLLDMREPHIHCDIQFHLEVPVFSAIPWAHTNVMLVNPDHWSFAYDSYAHAFDALVFRDSDSAEKFRAAFIEKGIPTDNIYVVPWCSSWQVADIKGAYLKDGGLGFVCFLAGSTNKYEYLKRVLPHWCEEDPRLTVYTTRADFEEGLNGLGLSSNITVKCEDLDEDNRYRLMALFRGHLVCSQGEAFGYAASNAEVAGAFTIMNRLPVFEESFSGREYRGVGWLSNAYEDSKQVRYSIAKPTDVVRSELEAAFKAFAEADFEKIRVERQESAVARFSASTAGFLGMLRTLDTLVKARRPSRGVFHCPPILNVDDCPPITIITPTYKREKLIDIAFHNLLSTDYPHNKIEWIVIEDNEKTPHLACEKIVSFQIQVPQIALKYIPIEGRMSIGEKRNHAIEQASNDIILFMDDDDHYPPTSFRRRVAWLTKGSKRGVSGGANIACCTTIALYDLLRGTSAVNVPPFDIPLGQRVSEATLTFRKSAWEERRFPNVSIAEGEGWINGREDQVIEMPPQQIIVAFSHGQNQSSRRIPPTDSKPACFWGFPKEYLVFIHKLAGIEVEEDTGRGGAGASKRKA